VSTEAGTVQWETAQGQLFKSFVGIIDSGRSDLSERHEELIRDGLNSLA
jgi:hypothetical protein